MNSKMLLILISLACPLGISTSAEAGPRFQQKAAKARAQVGRFLKDDRTVSVVARAVAIPSHTAATVGTVATAPVGAIAATGLTLSGHPYEARIALVAGVLGPNIAAAGLTGSAVRGLLRVGERLAPSP